MNRVFRPGIWLIFGMGLGLVYAVGSLHAQEAAPAGPVRAPLHKPIPAESEAFQQRLRERRADEERASRSPNADPGLTDSPKKTIVLTLWILKLSDSAKNPEADSKANLAWRVNNLPAEFGSLNDVRDLIGHLKDTGRVRSLHELRFMTLDGQPGHVQIGADKPQVIGVNMTNMGRTNSLKYTPVGMLVDVRPRIESEKRIQVQLDYNMSGMEKSSDIALTDTPDGKAQSADVITTYQLKTSVRLKSGAAVIVQSDSSSGPADKKAETQTDLIILGGSVADAAE